MSTNSSANYPGIGAATGGTVLTILGLGSAIDVDFLGTAWFPIAGVSILLIVAGLVRLRRMVVGWPVARRALTAAAILMSLFGLSHFYAMANQDVGVVLFSVFMVLGSVALIVAGISILRRSVKRGWQRWLPLLCGVWPILTIPAGAALGDLPHFAAIAIWGISWVFFGLAVNVGGIVSSISTAERRPLDLSRNG